MAWSNASSLVASRVCRRARRSAPSGRSRTSQKPSMAVRASWARPCSQPCSRPCSRPWHALGLVPSLELPQAHREPVHAAQEGPVVHQAPRQHAVEARAQRQLADANAHLVVGDRQRREARKAHVAEVRVGVEAAQVGLEQLVQERTRAAPVAAIAQIVRLEDGIGVEVLGVVTGQHLLHLEHRPRPASDDRLGVFVDRLAGLAPVFFGGIPLAERMQRERHEPQPAHVDGGRDDRPRQVRVPRVPPLTAGLHHRDLPRNDAVQVGCAQRDHVLAAHGPTASGPLLDRQHDQLDGLGQVEVVLAGLGPSRASCRWPVLGRGHDARLLDLAGAGPRKSVGGEVGVAVDRR